MGLDGMVLRTAAKSNFFLWEVLCAPPSLGWMIASKVESKHACMRDHKLFFCSTCSAWVRCGLNFDVNSRRWLMESEKLSGYELIVRRCDPKLGVRVGTGHYV